MKRIHAKSEGYEVIIEFENNNVVKVIDEFGSDIIRRVHVKKDGQEVKRVY